MRALHEAQLRVCEEVVVAATEFESVNNRTEFEDRFHHFSKLKHGKALAILDEDVLNHMVDFHNKMLDFEASNSDDFNYELRVFTGNSAFDVVHACRRMIARLFERESGGELSLLDCDYTMGWAYSHFELESTDSDA